MQINPEERRLMNKYHGQGDMNMKRIEKAVVNNDVVDLIYNGSNNYDDGKYDNKFEEGKQKVLDRKRRYLTKKMSLKAEIQNEVVDKDQYSSPSLLSSPQPQPSSPPPDKSNKARVRIELQNRITALKNKIRKSTVTRSEQLFQLNEKKNDIRQKLRDYQRRISSANDNFNNKNNNDNNTNNNNDNIDEERAENSIRIININKPSIKKLRKDKKILQKNLDKMQGFLTKLQNNNNAILKSQRNSSVLFVEAQDSSFSSFQEYDNLEDQNDQLKDINKQLVRSSDALTIKYFKEGEKRYIIQKALEQIRKLLSKKLRNQKIQKETKLIVDDIKTKTIETFAAVEKEFGPIDRSE